MSNEDKDVEKRDRTSTSSIAHDSDDGGDKDLDAEFGGPEQRKILEKKFLWKLDLRMSVLIVIYILNYVRFSLLIFGGPREGLHEGLDRSKQRWVMLTFERAENEN